MPETTLMHFSNTIPEPLAELHSGAVSLLRLLELYGVHHRAELDELWAAPGTEYLVLFADPVGHDRAILPVGPSHEYRRLESVLSLDIEALHAVCYTPALGVVQSVSPVHGMTLSGPEWESFKTEFPSASAEIIDAVTNSCSGEDPLRAVFGRIESRAVELAHREAELSRREHFVYEAEERLGARADAQLVRLAELEQREVEVLAATRDFQLRTGLPPGPFRIEKLTSHDRPVFNGANRFHRDKI